VKAVDLNHAVEEMARLLAVSIPDSVALRFELGAALPAVEADPVQLQQVLMNLVANAADAIGGGEGLIRLGTSRRDLPEAQALDFQGRAIPPGRYVVLEVADSGCGMDAEVLARIFEPFFTTKASGRGLGLGAMLGILKSHHASLQVDSEAGRGSTFRIFFPASQRSQGPEKAQLPEVQQPRGLALVVDDEADIRHAAASLFGVLGFRQVLEAGDGAEALDCFRERKEEISLVFMDLTMPRLSGREAFLAMRELNPDVKVILTSGYTEQEAFRDFGAEAPFGFLQKPYRFKQLREVVQQAIQQGA
ncbi:MAG TPA: ATP-binding protein, partial [Holophagaceae bacterium]|nr:ATP-binding protein [Holophagaceae bacterium]